MRNNQPIVSQASICVSSRDNYTIDKQELLNAGLSTHLASKPKNTLPSHQVSIMKQTLNSQSHFKQSQMTAANQIGSVISSYAGDNLYTIDEEFEAEYKFSGANAQAPQFNKQKLRSMLKQFGEYPEKYRFLTWKHILQLPSNKDAFASIIRKGVHPAFKVLHKRYPINSHRLYNKLVRTLSAFGSWCPVFNADNVEHLPQMVFPFIKCIQNDDLLVFELVMAVIVQFQQTWYEGYPAEPLVPLQAIEAVIEAEDPKLLQHLRAQAFTPQVYAWPILKTLFTEVLTRDDWLKLMDHLFTFRDDPELILFYCMSLLINQRQTLLTQVFTIDDMVAFQSK